MFYEDLTILDIIISLVLIAIILIGAYQFRPKRIRASSKYFQKFILFKIIFAILFVIIHVYIYKGGDTFLYFAGGKFIAKQILNNPTELFNYLFSSYEQFQTLSFRGDLSVMYFFKSSDVFFMSRIVSIFCLLSFNQFLASNIIFSILSAIGIWKLFDTLCELYPAATIYFAYGILFYPTIGIWGSGILKDPIALSSMGLILSSSHALFHKRNYLNASFLIILSIFICLRLKPYILYTFIPVMLFWLQGNISKAVKSQFVKYMLTPIVIVLSVIGGYLFLQVISESAGKYSLDNVQTVAEGFHDWHSYLAESRGQSGYSLGEVEFTPAGILEKSPNAIFVTYYRPFLFGDVHNLATAFEAIQSFILLLLTIYVLIKVRIIRFFILLFTNNDTRAFMIFALIFAIAVGLTSYNFGALSRYKIPCLPFFTASLGIVYYLGVKKRYTLN